MSAVFLYAPQDFHNLCQLARTLEAFGHRECVVYDPHRLVRERYGKARSRELRAVSAGAFEKIRWVRSDQPEEHLRQHAGRVIATIARPDAIPLSEHRCEKSDLIVFGPESSGLPPDVVAISSLALTIPLAGRTESLNLVVAIGVVLFEYQRQLGSRA